MILYVGGEVMTASINSGTSGVAMASQLQSLLLKNFAASFDKEDKDAEKKIGEKVKALIAEADKDNSGTLSKDELSKLDTKGNPDLAKTVSNLINGFDTYDTNHDNELSAGELKDAFKKLNKEFSMQDVAKMAKEYAESKDSDKYAVTSGNFSSALADKLINGYDKIASCATSSLGFDC